jgi:hypothetical protein
MAATDRSPTISEADARRAHRVLQSVWVIVSARQDDAVAADVARMGDRLRRALDARDWPEAAASVAEVRAWLATMAGVVTARLTHVFDGRD